MDTALLLKALGDPTRFKEERFTYHADCYFSFAGYGWIRTITEHNIRIYHSTRLRGKF